MKKLVLITLLLFLISCDDDSSSEEIGDNGEVSFDITGDLNFSFKSDYIHWRPISDSITSNVRVMEAVMLTDSLKYKFIFDFVDYNNSSFQYIDGNNVVKSFLEVEDTRVAGHGGFNEVSGTFRLDLVYKSRSVEFIYVRNGKVTFKR